MFDIILIQISTGNNVALYYVMVYLINYSYMPQQASASLMDMQLRSDIFYQIKQYAGMNISLPIDSHQYV